MQRDEKITTDTNLTQRFFNEHRSADVTENKLVNFIKSKYSNENISDKIIKIVGFPMWNKISIYKDQNTSLVSTAGSTTIYYIPMVRDSQNFVNAAMAIQASATDTTLTYLQDWQYLNLQNNNNSYTDSAETYAVFFMRQDQHVFGYNTFNIIDSNLFRFNNQKADSVMLNPAINQGNNLISVVEECFIVTVSYPCLFIDGNINNPYGNSSNVTVSCNQSWNYCTNIVGDTSPGVSGGTTYPTSPPPSSGQTYGGGGANTGVGWTPTLTGINYLVDALSLTTAQTTFLNQYPFLINQLFNYNSILPNADKKAISIEHIIKLMTDPSYLLFCQNQSANSDSGTVWWEDEEWLREINYVLSENNFNFYMRSKRPLNVKPEEFSSLCDGLKAISQRTKADPPDNKKERLGFITFDGKFILTGIGDEANVNFSIRQIGSAVYYGYPLSLDMPSQTYLGTIVDSANQEILIEVRASVHTHADGQGAQINHPDSKSQDDIDMAQKTFNISPYFKNYVIQPYGNTFKTGKFHKNDPGTGYTNVETNLSLDNICLHVTP